MPPRSAPAVTCFCDRSRRDDSRGDTAFRGMRSRTRDLPFSIPDSSPDLVSLISEEHVLWIDVSRTLNCLCSRPVLANLTI
jgi:hypothetical protein